MFRVKVIDAYKRGELTLDNIDEWNTAYNGGTPPRPNLSTDKILNYYINHVEPYEHSS